MIHSTSELGLGKSKITRVEPHLRNGVQETYPSKFNAGELNYKWDLEFEEQDENGKNISGVAISKSTTFKFSVNQIVTFKYTRNKFGLMFTELKATDIPQQGFTKSNSSFNDPLTNLRMAMSVCQSAAANMYINVKKQGKDSNIQLVANKFYEWVTKTSKDRNVLSLRWNALERSVSLIQIMKQDELEELLKNNTLSNEMIIKSEFYMKHVDAITS